MRYQLMSHDYGAYPKVHHMDLQRLRGGAERSEVEHLKRGQELRLRHKWRGEVPNVAPQGYHEYTIVVNGDGRVTAHMTR